MIEQDDHDVLVLAPNLDLIAAPNLKDDLLARRGGPLAIDAGEVQRLGGLCLQVLVAAHQDWTRAGHTFSFSSRSREFDEAIRLMGAAPHLGLATDTIGEC